MSLTDYLDTWAREKGVAGIPVASLRPVHSLYQGWNWNSYWLRWIAQGKEAYFVVARAKTEMVLIGEVLTQIRNQALDIDAAATNHAVQTQTLQAKNLAVKALAQFCTESILYLRFYPVKKFASRQTILRWQNGEEHDVT